MNISSRHDYWTRHLMAWKDSGLNQNSYCQENNLKPDQFSYWKRKLAQSEHPPRPNTHSADKAFIPVSINNASAIQELTIHLPNGCRITGVEHHHLPLLAQLAEVLR